MCKWQSHASGGAAMAGLPGSGLACLLTRIAPALFSISILDSLFLAALRATRWCDRCVAAHFSADEPTAPILFGE